MSKLAVGQRDDEPGAEFNRVLITHSAVTLRARTTLPQVADSLAM